LRAELRRLHLAAERQVTSVNLPPALHANLDGQAKLVGLSEADVDLLSFAVMLHSDGLLGEAAGWLGQISSIQLPVCWQWCWA